jgi:undecaprenyl-diphosphatase
MIQLSKIIIAAQVLLETLPISSSGHLFIIKELFTKYFPESANNLPSPLFCELLNVPTIFVIAFFFRKNIQLFTFRLLNLLKLAVSQKYSTGRNHHIKFFKILIRIIMMAIMTNLITFAAYNFRKLFIRTCATPYCSQLILLSGLFATMTILFLLKFKRPNTNGSLNFVKASIIGIAQSFGVFPGISRFGTTYAVARLLSISPRRSFEFSFILHSGLVLGILTKSVLENSKELKLIEQYLTLSNLALLSACAAISFLGLKFSYHMAKTKQFWKFGLYFPIPVGVLVWLILS